VHTPWEQWDKLPTSTEIFPINGILTGGGFKHFFLFSPQLGEMIHFDEQISSNGLVQPATTCSITENWLRYMF